MARKGIPDPLERRHLLAREIPADQALRIAEAYLAEGRRPEAVEFLEKAGAAEPLEALRAEAIASGDVFLLRAVARAQGRTVPRDDWMRLAEAAAASGRLRYEEEARRQAERGEQ